MQGRKFISILLTALLFLSIVTAFTPMRTMAAGTTYYVDSIGGNDNNSGTSTSNAWKSLSKVNSTTFQPGDQILFKRGCAWTGSISVTGSGTSNAPITYGAYGTGAAPIINGNGANQAIHIFNKQYITIQDLEITNNAATAARRHGIFIQGMNYGKISGIKLLNLDIHDVYGLIDWKQRADGSWQADPHTNAAIYMKVDETGGNDIKTWFDNILVDGCYIHDVHSPGFSSEGASYSSQDEYRYTNLVIQNSTFMRTYADGIIIGFGMNPVVQNVTAYYSGINGGARYWIVAIWSWTTNGGIYQYNDVGYTDNPRVNDGDSQAFDTDLWNLGNHIFQYNYTHNNEGGTLLGMSDTSTNDVIYRYNIAQNDGNNTNTYQVAFKIVNSRPAHIYNNTIYSSDGKGITFIDRANHVYQNNIFYSGAGNSYTFPSQPTFNNNVYYGFTANVNDSSKKTFNPMLASPGTAGDYKSGIDGYKLQAGSPCIDAGVSIANNGGKDYWGNSLYNGAPDIGAHEYVETSIPAPKLAQAYQVSPAVAIDGNMDPSWNGNVNNAFANTVIGTPTSPSDLSGSYGVLWDNTNLYLMFDITDDSKRNDSANVYDDDSIDLYLDMNNDHGTSYNADDFMYQFGYGDTAFTESKHNAIAGVSFAKADTANGYRIEIKIPWSTLGKTPSVDMVFGIDAAVNDDDDGGARDTQMTWNSWDNNAWSSPDRFGDCKLAESAPPQGAAYDDEFSGTNLDSKWNWIRPDAGNWSLTARPGYMRITSQSGDLNAAANNAKNILLESAPSGDWSAVVKLDGKPSANWAQAGLIVYQDDDNYVKMIRLYDNGNVFQFGKEAAGTLTSQNTTDNIASTVSYLKITKSGNSYSGYYSANGTDYTQVWTAQNIVLTEPKIGLISFAGTGLNADFDYIHVSVSSGKYEGESGTLLGGAAIGDDPAASGGKVVEYIDADGNGVQFNNVNAGTRLTLRYAAYWSGTVSLYVNGVHTANLSFTGKYAWYGESAYGEVTQNVTIPAGATVKLQHDSGDTPVNVDYIIIE